LLCRRPRGLSVKRIFALAAAAALALSAATAAPGIAAPPKPQHVMSLNLCADQLLLQMVPPERIASVSFLSLAAGKPVFAAEAAHVPVNYGTLEEVLAQRPDLVLAGTATTPTTRAFLKQAGIGLVEVPMAINFPQIRAVTRLVGHALGEDAKAETLIGNMDTTLAALDATRPAQRIVVAGWGGGGEIPGTDTLFNAILTAAGGVNAATMMRSTRFGVFDFEELLALRPDIIAFPDAAMDHPGLRREQIQHRVVQEFFARRQIAYPETLYSCGLPQSADAAKALRTAMLDIVSSPASNRPRVASP
ncbi:MAG TPA: ABC transporter substrate-binding protein, partial [Micropepsaceae bacterium]|nr:ABC transporter substrate-binding protein [Micropepsaceae bacterium]